VLAEGPATPARKEPDATSSHAAFRAAPPPFGASHLWLGRRTVLLTRTTRASAAYGASGMMKPGRGARSTSTSASGRLWPPTDHSHWTAVKGRPRATPINSVALSDGEGPGERSPSRRSVLWRCLIPWPAVTCRSG